MEPVDLDRALRMFKPFRTGGGLCRVRLRVCARWNQTKDTLYWLKRRQRFYASNYKTPKKPWNGKIATMMPTDALHEQMQSDCPHQRLIKGDKDLLAGKWPEEWKGLEA
jgi:hypothetical protein